MRRLNVYRSSPIILLQIFIFCGSVYALQGSTAENGSNATAVHDLGITGRGVKVGLITFGNVLATHRAFLDANGVTGVTNHNYTNDIAGFVYNFHDTPFAGIIKSRGTPSHPNDIGVAPDAYIHCGRIVDNNGGIQLSYIQTALNDLIGSIGCKVIVTGIQLPSDVNGNGQSQWTLAYDYYAQQNDVIFANAAGNSSPKIMVFGDGYNGITTGGLGYQITDNYNRVGTVTINGPTVDGRRKPEVMAPSTYQVAPGYNINNPSDVNYWNPGYGDGATSWAVPHTAGVAALLFEYANGTSEPADGHNVVIKAVMVNSTFPNIQTKNGIPTYPANPANVWDPNRGYGRIDALWAYQTLSAGRVNKGATAITSRAGWAYDTLGSSTHTYCIKGEKDERLVFTVTWNRMATRTGSTYYDETLTRFNIDVIVRNSSGDTISETDDVNNLGKIELLLPADGNYTVSLSNNTPTKSRAYGLAFELLAPITGDFDTNYIVDEKDLSQMALEWLTAGPDADIVHDSNNIVNWLDFAAFADNWLKIDKRYYNP